MREVWQLQNELEKPTSTPSVSPSDDTTPLAWDPQALPQHDDLVSDSQLTHTTATPKTTELFHRVLESIQNHKLQVTIQDLFSLSPSLREFVRSRLTEAVPQPSRSPTTKELIVATETIDKQMPVISISIGKNIVDDVLLDGGLGVNVITEEERRKLRLPKPSPAPFNLKMANGTIAKPTGLLRDVKIHIHGIPYIVTLTVIDCQTIKSDYSMLLGRPWLRNAKVIHDWANDQVQIMGNGTVKTVKVNRQLGYKVVTSHALVCYNFAEGIIDDEETILLVADPILQPVGTIDWDVLSSQLPTSANDQTNTPDRLFPHSPGTVSVDKTPIRDKVKTMLVAYWTHNEQDTLQLLNLGIADDPKLIKMNANLNPQLTIDATSLFKEYRDVFAFSYEDLRGIPEHIATHHIELDTAISPCHQTRYRMNPNYAKAVKEDLEKLLKAGFIEPVDQATWLSSIVVVPKKNGKLRICVDFRCLNAATKKDPYPLPFMDEVLDTVIGYVAYSFIDYFSGYHQVHIHADDRYKTTFITEWGAYVWVVMPFGLKNAPPTYQRIINQIFKDYLNDFMKLFLDDFSVYNDVATHLPKLRLIFERCRQYGVRLYPDKCIFYVPSGVILGYIVCQAGKFPDPKKIEALVQMPPPKNVKAIQTFNGLAQFNQCFIKDYAGIMEPITRLTRKGVVFDWTTECENAY